MKYACPTCGLVHDDLPAVAFDAPAPYEWASSRLRAEEWRLDADLCVHNGVDHYVRGVLSIPIIGSDKRLDFGVWSTLSETNFHSYADGLGDPTKSLKGEMFGWFSNQVPGYPETMGLKCLVTPQDSGRRPTIELEPTDHPLARHQVQGISMDAALEYLRRHLEWSSATCRKG